MGGRSKKRGGAKGRGREGGGENPASGGNSNSAQPMANVEPLTRRVLPSNDKTAESTKQGAVELFFSRRARPPARPAMTAAVSHDAPVFTEEELEFLQSVIPPPPGGY
ncbi:uncharacterized protein LOC123403435 [Hordeum vulgare subsp. vulgare]|uniref:uncharacterized protein LOC123403435 n=1 Tax=Hordeum vulgare subsp. vulgare TaxID=112509 RepID=UPI001D1A4B49|nr:uncharacterized protein LOC123403435 [Hordeum vulgare subsp. vulgare]KAI4981662.1 hypothetical protein ZWY2020_022154 [Hordeum vulgare]